MRERVIVSSVISVTSVVNAFKSCDGIRLSSSPGFSVPLRPSAYFAFRQLLISSFRQVAQSPGRFVRVFPRFRVLCSNTPHGPRTTQKGVRHHYVQGFRSWWSAQERHRFCRTSEAPAHRHRGYRSQEPVPAPEPGGCTSATGREDRGDQESSEKTATHPEIEGCQGTGTGSEEKERDGEIAPRKNKRGVILPRGE